MKAPWAALVATLLLLTTPPALAGAARTRPGGGSGSAGRSGGHSGSSTAQRPSGSAPTRVSGHATYGYTSGGGYGYGGSYPWYPYYGSSYGYGWGGWYGGWGSPWYSMGVWWPPDGYYVSTQPERLTLGGSRSATPAIVETDIDPRKATILLDGTQVGRAKDFNGTWDRLSVSPGRHTLEFSAPGFMTLRSSIRVDPGRFYRIAEDLQKGTGIDPRSQSAPPEVLPGEEPTSRADAGEPNPAGSTLRRGLLKIEADPPDAAVYLDGEFLASVRELESLHGAIPVAVGPHEVEVTHPRMKSRSLRVDVSGEEPVRVDLRVGEGR